MGAPADFAEMQASGRFTPKQLASAQTETNLRQQYIDQQAQPVSTKFGQGVGNALTSIGSGVAAIPKLAAGIARDVGFGGGHDVAAITRNPPAGIANSTNPTGIVSALEGSSQAATGLLGIGADLGQGQRARMVKSQERRKTRSRLSELEAKLFSRLTQFRGMPRLRQAAVFKTLLPLLQEGQPHRSRHQIRT